MIGTSSRNTTAEPASASHDAQIIEHFCAESINEYQPRLQATHRILQEFANTQLPGEGDFFRITTYASAS